MELVKYKKSLYLFIGLCVSIIIALALTEPFRGDIDITPLIPFSGFIESMIILLALLPLVAIIGSLFFGYVLVPLFLLIHKKIFGRKMVYGFQNSPPSQEFKTQMRGIFAALMAINFAIILTYNTDLLQSILNPDLISGGIAIQTIMGMIIFMILTLGFSMALFSPIWFLLDAGIVYSTNDDINSQNIDRFIEVRTVGGWYQYLLKGYAGIAAIITYYQISILFLNAMAEVNFIVLIVNLIIFIPFPFIIAIISIPAMIILDITKEHRIRHVRNIARKLGINQLLKVKITLEDMRK